MFSQQIQIHHKSYENNYKQKQLLYKILLSICEYYCPISKNLLKVIFQLSVIFSFVFRVNQGIQQ